MENWVSATLYAPLFGRFYWVKVASGETHLAFWNGNKFQTAETAGDREGLSIEYITDVTHFREVEEPVDHGLTELEKQACGHIVSFWNLYMQMPDAKDTDDLRVIRDAVHAIQCTMALRVARRVDPDFWR